MSTQSSDPAEQVPEADLVEQQMPVDEETADPEEATTVVPQPAVSDEFEADEADVLEQRAIVSEDEDYPRAEE